jgi:hypothetical protein
MPPALEAPPPAPEATPPAPEATPAPTTASSAEPVIPPVVRHVPQHPQAPVRRPIHLRAIALAGVAFVVVAVLAVPRQSSAPDADKGVAGSQPEPHARAADLVALSLPPAALRSAPIAPIAAFATVAPAGAIAPSTNTLGPKPEKHRLVESTKAAAPNAVATPVAEVPSKDDAATRPAGSDAIAPPTTALISATSGEASPVTITGCLEVSVDHDEFRLTDTEGVDAPRSRSWRTGFLKKRSAPVALVEPPDRRALQTQVGRRVAATGLLTSHDLKVSALRVVGSSCN